MTTQPDATRGIASAASAALKAAGISQRDAAELTGIPLPTLSRRLTGKTPFKTTELEVIAQITGTTLTDIVLRGTENAA